MYKNPQEHKKAVRRWSLENEERRREMGRAYDLRNRAKRTEAAKLRRNKPGMRVQLATESLARYHADPEYRRRALELAAHRRVAHRKQIFRLLGGEQCSKCGFDDYRALQIDHKNGGGLKEFRENPTLLKAKKYLEHIQIHQSDYQVLCANCNWIKRFENSEVPNYRTTCVTKA